MDTIKIFQARQNNLKGFDLEIPHNRLTVITGPSGAGKSSIALDTLYAEGQRLYSETFSAYARQFLDRMDRPQVRKIESILPAVAVTRKGAVRTARTTVGTLIEATYALEHLFARAAVRRCDYCGDALINTTKEGAVEKILALAKGSKVMISAPVAVPRTADNESKDFSSRVRSSRVKELLTDLLEAGWVRVLLGGRVVRLDELAGKYSGTEHERGEDVSDWDCENLLEVVLDRIKVSQRARKRLAEAVEEGWRLGRGQVNVRAGTIGDDFGDSDGDGDSVITLVKGLACPGCNRGYIQAHPHVFSFNSPRGACPECGGYGSTLELDPAKIIPDPDKTLRQGAVHPFTMPSFKQAQLDLMAACKRVGIDPDVSYGLLPKEHQAFVFHGDSQFYGVDGLFEYLETKKYKMHVRVLLARFRHGVTCKVCRGSRLASEALRYELWGKTIAEVSSMTAKQLAEWLESHRAEDGPTETLLWDLATRVGTLKKLGLAHLTLDRPARTLSGGELARVHLTRAIGTRLAGTLYVLDEPTVGLHSTDVTKLCKVMEELCAMENTVVVVEHHPQVIAGAQHLIELGPGAGENGGEVVFEGTSGKYERREKEEGEHHPLKTDGLNKNVLKEKNVRGEGSSVGLKKRSKNHPPSEHKGESSKSAGYVSVEGASANNLKELSLSIPLGELVVFTGVSGSGKSSLLEDVLYKNMVKSSPSRWVENAKTLDVPKSLKDIRLLDQNPIGRTSRSNPATYMKAMDPIRKIFAAQEKAQELGMGPGAFSFNSPQGRCRRCGGAGFEKVEMQFLADMELRCPDCDGKRYRTEVLEVTLHGLSVADVLGLTVEESLSFFAKESDFISKIRPLEQVGLGYIRLGQPATTLSGGEAQRLKLARTLRSASEGALILLDEPTVGLHSTDVALLVRLLKEFVRRGTSVWVVEHDLFLISQADHIIDLGPGGGPEGGRVVVQGTPKEVMTCGGSLTGGALRADSKTRSQDRGRGLVRGRCEGGDVNRRADRRVQSSPTVRGQILIQGAQEHNLQDIDVKVPRKKLVGITGVSGSGKSTLAFDILFAEGQRRYLESKDAYVRTAVRPLPRPHVEKISGLPPTVAVSQMVSGGGMRSTVATVTEISHYLRLLFSRFGTQYCPECDVPIQPTSAEGMTSAVTKMVKSKNLQIAVPVVRARKGHHKPLMDRLIRKKFQKARVDGDVVMLDPPPKLARYKEHNIDVIVAVLKRGSTKTDVRRALAKALEIDRTIIVIDESHEGDGADIVLSMSRTCPSCNRGFERPDPLMLSFNSRRGACMACGGLGFVKPGSGAADPEELEEGVSGKVNPRRPKKRRRKRGSHKREKITADNRTSVEKVCVVCGGSRLRPEAAAMRFNRVSLPELMAYSATDALDKINKMKTEGPGKSRASEIIGEIVSRISALNRLGLGYLTLDRRTGTLSSGEAQRVRLAALLGSELSGACYVLDEPTVGLHPRDVTKMVAALRSMTKRGCTVLVVEHDEETIRACDYILDLGPGAGKGGGKITAKGTVGQIEKSKKSVTGKALRESEARRIDRSRKARNRTSRKFDSRTEDGFRTDDGSRIVEADVVSMAAEAGPAYGSVISATQASPRSAGGEWLTIHGARLHNLKNISVSFQLRALNAVTGVSGSGKSSLVMGVLPEALKAHLEQIKLDSVFADKLESDCVVSGLKMVTSAPIGHTSRSVPATYLGIFSHIRELMAGRPEARVRGYTPSHFSFNVKGGRCENCAGRGSIKVEMKFLPNVAVRCEECGGSRYRPEILDVRYRGYDIASILDMPVEEGLELFKRVARIRRPLELLVDLGLGYLPLGQPSPTLSGGEAQRIRLASEIASPTRDKVYLLDEPTTGLHMADVKRLNHALRQLVNEGNTVVVIEHNLDVMAHCDFVIDLGPEGGAEGGTITASGTPVQIASARTPTGRFLGKHIGG